MRMRKFIIYLCLFVVLTLQYSDNVSAVPNLQLYIPGASYDGATQTWTYLYNPGVPFTLQVISANKARDNVFVSAALAGAGQNPLPPPVNNIITIAGYASTNPNFIWGTPSALSPHGIFPTYYAEFNVGSFNLSQTVYDMQPGQTGSADGQARDFSVTINATEYGTPTVHFDAYWWYNTKNHGKWIFAPYSHDAEGGGGPPIPEPATIALLSMGIATMIGYKGKRFLKKS